MRAFTAFFKKEFMESFRTYKLIILIAVFTLLGIMSPLMAKMTPEILKSVNTGGIVFEIPEPTALDAWSQFFKNVGQMGLLALIIVFSGIMANEFTKGTLINLLTKGVKRETVILAKFIAAAVIWTAAYLLCFVVSLAYTAFYWRIEGLHFLPFFGLWLFGLLLISLLILGGTIFKSFYGSLCITGGALILAMLVNIAPQAGKYNPISLSGETIAILSGQKQPADFVPALIICAGLIVSIIAASILVFRKKSV